MLNMNETKDARSTNKDRIIKDSHVAHFDYYGEPSANDDPIDYFDVVMKGRIIA